MDIKIAITESEIAACFPAMRELRPHLTETDFVSRVQRQMKNHGYVLVYVALQDEVVAVAGYRIAEFLAWGRTFYVDDLVCREAFRKQGYGGKLLDFMAGNCSTGFWKKRESCPATSSISTRA